MSPTTHLAPVLNAKLKDLLEKSNRADPLDEAVLCVVEAAVIAVHAAEQARLGGNPDEVRSWVHEVLAAARAAVTAANFAVVSVKDTIGLAKEGRAARTTDMCIQRDSVAASRVLDPGP